MTVNTGGEGENIDPELDEDDDEGDDPLGGETDPSRTNELLRKSSNVLTEQST